MKFTEIADPLTGERTVAVVPTPSPTVDATWQRQRFVTGRSVSAPAMEAEQEHRAGHVVITGQSLRPGLISGLVVGAETDEDGQKRLISVGPGMGICASGEDVILPRGLLAVALELPVRVAASQMEKVGGKAETTLGELIRALQVRIPPVKLPPIETLPPIEVTEAPVDTGGTTEETKGETTGGTTGGTSAEGTKGETTGGTTAEETKGETTGETTGGTGLEPSPGSTTGTKPGTGFESPPIVVIPEPETFSEAADEGPITFASTLTGGSFTGARTLSGATSTLSRTATADSSTVASTSSTLASAGITSAALSGATSATVERIAAAEAISAAAAIPAASAEPSGGTISGATLAGATSATERLAASDLISSAVADRSIVTDAAASGDTAVDTGGLVINRDVLEPAAGSSTTTVGGLSLNRDLGDLAINIGSREEIKAGLIDSGATLTPDRADLSTSLGDRVITGTIRDRFGDLGGRVVVPDTGTTETPPPTPPKEESPPPAPPKEESPPPADEVPPPPADDTPPPETEEKRPAESPPPAKLVDESPPPATVVALPPKTTISGSKTSSDLRQALSQVVIGNRVRPRAPFLAVLTVEPIVVDGLAQGPAADDCCERDPDSEPFEDWRYTDGARLLWIPIAKLAELPGAPQTDWVADAIAFDHSQSGQRNRIAWALFNIEAGLGDTPMPWEERTVPIALVAFDTNGNILWVDRAAAIRRGGRREEPDYLTEASGDEALWQARVEQFNDQLAEETLSPTTQLSSLVRWLPPAGVLPKEIFDFDNRLCRAFPNGWGISATPIPLEQVDQTLRGTSSLAPFDLSSNLGDEVKVLLPIHQAAWDPELLRIESVHPDFYTALDEAASRRDGWLGHRAELRSKIAALWDAVGGASAVPLYPEDPAGDTDAAAIADAVIWKNPTAIAHFVTLGGRTPPLLANASQFIVAATAMIADATLGQAIGASFGAVAGGPVVPFPTDGAALPSSILGPGFALDCGWTHPFMATARGLALRTAPVVYVVAGTLDTESLDRAIAFAGTSPLVVLAAELHERAAEELIWHHHRGHAVPAVAILGGRSASRVDRLTDIRVRLGLAQVFGTTEFASAGRTLQVVMSRTQTTVLGVSGGDNTAIAGRAASIRAAIAALPTGDPLAAEHGARLPVLEGQAAGLRVPDPSDGSLKYGRVAYTIRVLDSLRKVTDLGGLGANGALGQAVGTLTEYGTVPIAAGLGVAKLEELKADLATRTSPPDGLRIVTDQEIAILDDMGIAGLIGVLAEKSKRADDAADFSFLQIQAAVFRLREQMVGRDKATRMAASPILADLARIIDADTTPDQLGRFFTAMQQPVEEEEGEGGGGSTTPTWLAKAISYEVPLTNVYSKLAISNVYEPELMSFAGSFVESGSFAEFAGGATVGARTPAPGSAEVDTDLVAPEAAAAPSTNFVPDSGLRAEAPSVRDAGEERFTPSAGETLFAPSSGGVNLAAAGFAAREVTFAPAAVEAPTFFGESEGPETFLPAGGSSPPAPTINLSSFTTAAASKARLLTKAPMVNRMIAINNALKVAQPVNWNLRTSGVKDRVEQAIAIELRQAAFRLRATITQTVFNLEMNLAGVKFPGFLEPVSGGTPKSVWKALTATLVEEVLQGKHEIETQDGSAADLFSSAVRSLEIAAAMLRIVEARIREVQEIISVCLRYQAEIENLRREAEARLADVEDQIAEARHDVTNTISLRTEEEERVTEVNKRRAGVLAEHVPFVVFHRGRVVDLVDDTPIHDVEPALRRSPVLDALRQPAPPAPDELHDMVDLWREVPVAWVPDLAELVKRIDRAEALRRTLELSRRRAAEAFAEHRGPPSRVKGQTGMAAVSAMFGLRKHAVVTKRQTAHAAQPLTYHALTWKQIVVEAPKIVTIGDMLSSSHVRSELSRAASRELDHVYRVAANLYRELAEIQPNIRAAWVRLLSEYDDPMDLSDLSALPRWAEVGTGDAPDPFRKRELQALVGWLFSRVNPKEEDAVALMNDLVRVCILLASHAPVGRIIAGAVEHPTPVEPERMLPIRIDPARVRVGMVALVMVKEVVVARAVVEDLGDQRAMARIVSAAKSGVVLQAGDAVRFVEADGVAHAIGGVKK